MQRDGIRTERIDDDEIVAAIGGVTEDHRRVIAAILQQLEKPPIARQLFHRRIDLVECPRLARQRIASKISDPKPNDADTRYAAQRDRRKEAPEWSPPMVVAQRRGAFARAGAGDPVDG